MLDNATLPATPNTASQSTAGTHDASITPAYTGSRVFSAEINYPGGASAPVAAANNTVIDSVSDTISNTTQNYGYGTFESTATMTAGTAFTAGSSDSATPGGCAVLEVQPSGTITTDASGPATVSSVSVGLGVTGVTTAAFTPPAGTLILALVTAAGAANGQVTMTVTDSYGLVWTEAVAANNTGQGYAGIWYAFAPAAVTAPAAATLTPGISGNPYAGSLTAAGGYAPYTYTLASGSLPNGLAISPDGIILGTPNTAVTSSFTVTTTDSSGASSTSGTQTLTIGAAAIPASPHVAGQWQAKGSPYSYGTTPVNVKITDHDWVFAIVTWTGAEDVSLAYVNDNAHNVYRPVGNPFTNFWSHVQVFAVPNARPATVVYVSTSAFVRDLQVHVIDVRNMEPGYTVDVIQGLSGNTTTGFTGSITTAQPDFVLAAGAVRGAGVSISLPSAWAPQKMTSRAGTASSVVGWQYAATPGAQSAAFTVSGAHAAADYAGAVIGIYSQSPPVISGGNPAWPNIKVYAAFGYNPGLPTAPPTWTDISSRFLGFNGPRGRSFELDELSASDVELDLDNFDGALSPGAPGAYNISLITPVQIMADWQGRRYPLYTGIVTSIPQTYDFERGMVKLTLTDDYSKLPQVLLPSCMMSELLYDVPTHVWPLNEGLGAARASNWSGRSTAVLVPVNSKYGGGLSGNTPQTGFGNQASSSYPLGLEGSTDTTWGNYTGQVGTGVASYVKGTALADRNDRGLPWLSTGCTYEVWAQIANNTANLDGKAVIMVLTDEKGTGGGGCFLRLVAENVGSVASPKTAFYVLGQGLSWASGHKFATKNVFDGGWHHYAISVAPDKHVSVYLDGVLLSYYKGSFPAGRPTRLTFGGDITVSPYWGTKTSNAAAGGGFFTGQITLPAAFDRTIDPERIKSHYLSGATGFVGEANGQRIQRILTYARWAGPQAIETGSGHMQIFNYLGGGYASSGLSGAIGQTGTAGGGFTDNGAQADVTISDIALSECGLLLVGADGTFGFRGRGSQYNMASKGTLGDQDYALNQVTTFANGLGPWSAVSGCTLGTSTSWSYSGGSSALLTVTGSPSTASAQTELLALPANRAAAISGWVMSPTGCYAQLNLSWYGAGGFISTYSGTLTWCPPMTPVFLGTNLSAAPGSATGVRGVPTVANSPATGTQLYFDHTRVSPAVFEVPYNGDVEIKMDIQYLFNDIVVTRNIDQATYRAKNDASRGQYYSRVYTRTIYTAEADVQSVVDVANWLLGSYDVPQNRVTRVTVDAAVHPEAWPFVLGIDIGDVVYFTRNPVQGAQVVGGFMVLSIEPNVTKDTATFTYVLAPGPGVGNSGIVAFNDPVNGIVNSSSIVAW